MAFTLSRPGFHRSLPVSAVLADTFGLRHEMDGSHEPAGDWGPVSRSSMPWRARRTLLGGCVTPAHSQSDLPPKERLGGNSERH